jgi:hypothetical protein
MIENRDFVTKEEREKIVQISKKEHLSLAGIGRQCEIKDRAFWKRIMDANKPIPEHSRIALNKFLGEREQKENK